MIENQDFIRINKIEDLEEIDSDESIFEENTDSDSELNTDSE